jgi:hypothetical protein
VDARRGSDDNPGNAGQPFETFSKAAALARAGDTVRIATGVHRQAVRLDQSGTAEKRIRFEAALAANVVGTSADRLTPAEAGPDNDSFIPVGFGSCTPARRWASGRNGGGRAD